MRLRTPVAQVAQATQATQAALASLLELAGVPLLDARDSLTAIIARNE